MHQIAVIVGSLRRESANRKLARALAKLGGDRLRFDLLELADLPMYDDDLLDPGPPAPVRRMKAAVAASDAVLFVSPEYNRSMTPVIKNVIDWGTRPFGTSCWTGKPASIIGTSPGATGTAAGQAQLRGLVVVVGMVLMGQPEIYLTWKEGMIDAEHNIVDDAKRQFLGKYLVSFDSWIERHGTAATVAP